MAPPRGRKPKNVVVAGSENVPLVEDPLAPSQLEPVQKNSKECAELPEQVNEKNPAVAKRGRPPKAPAAAKENVKRSGDPPVDAKVIMPDKNTAKEGQLLKVSLGKSGRPSKTPLMESETATDAKDLEPNDTKQMRKSEPVMETEKKAPGKRGRPAKSPVNETKTGPTKEDTQTGEPKPSDEAENAVETIVKAPAAKRGRPAKAVVGKKVAATNRHVVRAEAGDLQQAELGVEKAVENSNMNGEKNEEQTFKVPARRGKQTKVEEKGTTGAAGGDEKKTESNAKTDEVARSQGAQSSSSSSFVGLTPQEVRQRNLEENMRIMRELKLKAVALSAKKAVSTAMSGTKRAVTADGEPRGKAAPVTKRPRKVFDPTSVHERRKSNRIQNQPAKSYDDLDGESEDFSDLRKGNNRRSESHMTYTTGTQGDRHCTDHTMYRFRKPHESEKRHITGHVPGVPVGFVFHSREEASWAQCHRGLVAGVAGGPEQVFSIVLNGGYEDDMDWGDTVMYTGEGGRSLKGTKSKPENRRTGPQTKNQVLQGKNLGLFTCITTKKPVRVLRGYKLNSEFSPVYGYRYDGLYFVECHREETGVEGFMVQRFFLKRVEGQPPLGHEEGVADDHDGDDVEEESKQDAEDNAGEGAEDTEKGN